MSPEFPPRPSKRTTVALAAVALVTFLYSIVVAAQILLWFVLVGIAIGLYLAYLLIVAVFRLVEAVERIATAAEVDSGIRTVDEARTSAGADGGDPEQPSDAHPPEEPASEGSTDEPAANGPVADVDAPDPGNTPLDESTGSNDPDDRPDGD